MVTAFFVLHILGGLVVMAGNLIRLSKDGPLIQRKPDTRRSVARVMAIHGCLYGWMVWCLFQWKAANGGW